MVHPAVRHEAPDRVRDHRSCGSLDHHPQRIALTGRARRSTGGRVRRSGVPASSSSRLAWPISQRDNTAQPWKTGLCSRTPNLCVGVVWTGVVRRWSWGKIVTTGPLDRAEPAHGRYRGGLRGEYTEVGGRRVPDQAFGGTGNKDASSVIYLWAIVYHSIGVFSGHMVAGRKP